MTIISCAKEQAKCLYYLVYITFGLTYGGPVALLRFVRLCLFLFRVFVDFTGHLALFSKDEA